MKVTILGGGGYVGTNLTNKLLDLGHQVVVLDTFWFGNHLSYRAGLECIRGDIRDYGDLLDAIVGSDAVIHLACVSNDPSFDLDPTLGKSINLDCFRLLLKVLSDYPPKKFIYASSSSVYGIHDGEVTEETECNPLTDYSKFKLDCEEMLHNSNGFPWTIVRPATVCGYSPRMRFDLVVNAMSGSALWDGQINVFGGEQYRANIHIDDMVDAYVTILNSNLHGYTFNVGNENMSLNQIANTILGAWPTARIAVTDTVDNRSYHVNSDRIKKVLGFVPRRTILDAFRDIGIAKHQAKLGSPTSKSEYSNIRKMKELLNEGPL